MPSASWETLSWQSRSDYGRAIPHIDQIHAAIAPIKWSDSAIFHDLNEQDVEMPPTPPRSRRSSGTADDWTGASYDLTFHEPRCIGDSLTFLESSAIKTALGQQGFSYYQDPAVSIPFTVEHFVWFDEPKGYERNETYAVSRPVQTRNHRESGTGGSGFADSRLMRRSTSQGSRPGGPC